MRLGNERVGEMATLDHDRERRTGIPEVVYGASKSAEEIAVILQRLSAPGHGALATLVSVEKWSVIQRDIPQATYWKSAQVVEVPRASVVSVGSVAIVSAGTSDGRIAEEASVVARFLGASVTRFNDVGVAGISRLLDVIDEIRSADVVVAVAGMEGALPSVLCGLVESPLIAVPTSVGYGVGLGGFVAMQSMLASCSPGIVVVNIDNGFGAAVSAVRILRGMERRASKSQVQTERVAEVSAS